MSETAQQKYSEVLPELKAATGVETDADVIGRAAPFVQLLTSPQDVGPVWRWLWEQRDRTSLWPVVLGEEALWMIEEAEAQPNPTRS